MDWLRLGRTRKRDRFSKKHVPKTASQGSRFCEAKAEASSQRVSAHLMMRTFDALFCWLARRSDAYPNSDFRRDPRGRGPFQNVRGTSRGGPSPEGGIMP